MGWDRTRSTRRIPTPTYADTLTANFVAAVPTNVITSPAGLTVNVDGQNDSKGSQRLWAEGQTHHLIAPPTQTDATGRPWKFASWSQGGTADQSYTVPSRPARADPDGDLRAGREAAGGERAVRIAVHGRRRGLHHALRAPRQTHRSAGASGRPCFGGAGRLQPLHFRSWNGGSTATSSPGHHWRSTCRFSSPRIRRFTRLTATLQPANHGEVRVQSAAFR